MYKTSINKIGVTILNILRILRGNYNADHQKLNIGDIGAIGTFAVIWSIFSQSIGLFSALQAMEAAGDISPQMIYGGIKVSFITTLYGTFIFLISRLIVLVINNWSRRKSEV